MNQMQYSGDFLPSQHLNIVHIFNSAFIKDNEWYIPGLSSNLHTIQEILIKTNISPLYSIIDVIILNDLFQLVLLSNVTYTKVFPF